jgi:hypothetical protein
MFFVCSKIPKILPLPISVYVGCPLFIPAVPLNSRDSGFVVLENPTVHHVLRVAAWAQIVSSIIERVMIDVVTALSLREPQDNAVHHRSAVRSSSVPTLRGIAPLRVPPPLGQFLKISRVDDGLLTTRKLDGAVC